jgi:cytochrome c5
MEDHSSPIKTPKQLIFVVLLAFAVPIAIAGLLSQLVTSGEKGMADNSDHVLARIQPVGTVVLAEATGPKGMMTGDQVYGQVCKTCHEAGLAGAPKVGDKAAWGKVIAQGEKTAFDHAINGFKAMPPRGGNSDLTDDEVKRAVVFMASKAGATWTAPPIAATAAAAAPRRNAGQSRASRRSRSCGDRRRARSGTGRRRSAAPAAASDGKKIYETTCVACHGAGLAGAPKFGDKAAWAPRIKTGMPTLYQTAIAGKGAMPPKGGNLSLSDADVKAAVDYMVGAVEVRAFSATSSAFNDCSRALPVTFSCAASDSVSGALE